jgi:hypothetical protein
MDRAEIPRFASSQSASLDHIWKEPFMFESAEIDHVIDKETYDTEVPALREACSKRSSSCSSKSVFR